MDGTEVLVSLAGILLLLCPPAMRRPSGKRKQAAILLANPASKKETKEATQCPPPVSPSVLLPRFSGMRCTSHPGRLASPFCRPIRKFVKKRMSFCLFFFFLFFSPFRSRSSSARRRRRRQTDEPELACPKHEAVASASDEQISLAVLEARRQQKMASSGSSAANSFGWL